MSLEEIVAKTKKPVTKADLRDGLVNLGVSNVEVLIVHCKMSSFGWIVGGAQAIIEAIYDVTGHHATIVMPSQSADNSNPEEWQYPAVPKQWHALIKEHMPAYNPHLTPMTGMSEVVKVFAMQPAAIRSMHPQVSFIAVGRKADWILQNHELNDGLGEGSPLQKLYAQNAKILCLGTSYETVTALHLAEYQANCRATKSCEAAIMKKGNRTWMKYEDIELNSEVFEEIGASYEKHSNVNKVQIGLAECKLLDMCSLIDYATEYLTKNKPKI